jgi:hypothetical protein
VAQADSTPETDPPPCGWNPTDASPNCDWDKGCPTHGDHQPIPWEELKPYEKEQGGYWFYPRGRDVYGNGKVWIRVPRPEEPGELDRAVNEVRHLAQLLTSRARDTGNEEMTALAKDLNRAAASRTGGHP